MITLYLTAIVIFITYIWFALKLIRTPESFAEIEQKLPKPYNLWYLVFSFGIGFLLLPIVLQLSTEIAIWFFVILTSLILSGTITVFSNKIKSVVSTILSIVLIFSCTISLIFTFTMPWISTLIALLFVCLIVWSPEGSIFWAEAVSLIILFTVLGVMFF